MNDLGPLWHFRHGYPDRAGFKESTTSRDAAVAIEAKGRARTLRDAVLAWYDAGHQGTADECAAALGESVLAIRPRVTELSISTPTRPARLERSGQRRCNASGHSAHVWRLATLTSARAG